MRHVILAAAAIAAAWLLAPYAHTLTQGQRYGEIAAIVIVFAAVDALIGRALKPKKKPASSGYAYTAAKRR